MLQTFSPKIKPICLPTQDQDFGGKPAEAAGWGMDGPDVNPKQSSWLISVDLFVSKMKYDHSKMFGTELSTNLMGDYKDACSGDSGAHNINFLMLHVLFSTFHCFDIFYRWSIDVL